MGDRVDGFLVVREDAVWYTTKGLAILGGKELAKELLVESVNGGEDENDVGVVVLEVREVARVRYGVTVEHRVGERDE